MSKTNSKDGETKWNTVSGTGVAVGAGHDNTTVMPDEDTVMPDVSSDNTGTVIDAGSPEPAEKQEPADKEGTHEVAALFPAEGNYQYIRTIGKGGQGSVCLVFDKRLACQVAVKILPASLVENNLQLEMLRNEILIPRKIRHAGIAAIYDLYEIGKDNLGISMEYIEGSSLRDWVDNQGSDRWHSAGECIRILRNLAESLSKAHENKVVHRDLKPQNVMLRDDDVNKPVLLDFGIAVASENRSVTHRVGTFSYMAPEQYENPAAVDCRADLFAFGIIAYEMFTGQLPPCSLRYVRQTSKVPRINVGEITPIYHFNPRVPLQLDSLIRKLLSYNPEDRLSSAVELYENIRGIEVLPEEASIENACKQEAAPSGLEFAVIPEGFFYIGSHAADAPAWEKPRRRLLLSSYKMSVTTVTNSIYKRFLEHTGLPHPPWLDDETFGRNDHPVVGVTWEEARLCAVWLGGRLPTEAQWEKAAKSDGLLVYPWGNDYRADAANIDFYYKTTTPAGSFPQGKSPYGCLDMAGNVREWCLDWYSPTAYSSLATNAKDAGGPANGVEKILRGGGFRSLRYEARCTFRGHAPAVAREPDIGFRVVIADPS